MQWILEPLEHEAVADLLLKLVERRTPLRRNATGLDVDCGGVPAQGLIENRLQRKLPLDEDMAALLLDFENDQQSANERPSESPAFFLGTR